MFVICMLNIAMNVGGINIIVHKETKGKVIKENNVNYLIDFSEGVKGYKLVGSPSDYSSILMKKEDCI